MPVEFTAREIADVERRGHSATREMTQPLEDEIRRQRREIERLRRALRRVHDQLSDVPPLRHEKACIDIIDKSLAAARGKGKQK